MDSNQNALFEGYDQQQKIWWRYYAIAACSGIMLGALIGEVHAHPSVFLAPALIPLVSIFFKKQQYFIVLMGFLMGVQGGVFGATYSSSMDAAYVAISAVVWLFAMTFIMPMWIVVAVMRDKQSTFRYWFPKRSL